MIYNRYLLYCRVYHNMAREGFYKEEVHTSIKIKKNVIETLKSEHQSNIY